MRVTDATPQQGPNTNRKGNVCYLEVIYKALRNLTVHTNIYKICILGTESGFSHRIKTCTLQTTFVISSQENTLNVVA